MAGPLPPVAVGLFGLGTGYFVRGGSALAGYQKTKSPEFEKAMGQWGIWMPGFCQFFTSVYLISRPHHLQRLPGITGPLYGGAGIHGVGYTLVLHGLEEICRVSLYEGIRRYASAHLSYA
jgi:hypothetical protein